MPYDEKRKCYNEHFKDLYGSVILLNTTGKKIKIIINVSTKKKNAPYTKEKSNPLSKTKILNSVIENDLIKMITGAIKTNDLIYEDKKPNKNKFHKKINGFYYFEKI